MKYIKVLDNNGNNRFIRLYPTKRSKNVIAVKTAEGEILYAGSGSTVSGPTVMLVKTASGVQRICEYADDIPSHIKYIASYTATQDVVLSKDMFPFGGKIVAWGSKGTTDYGAGGKGSSATMYFGALLHDTVLHITIGVNNGSAGTNGTNTTVYGYFNTCSGRYTASNCPDKSFGSSSNATNGGAGGQGSRATLDYTGETINAYGGGGGGGDRGSIYYAYDCEHGGDHYGGYDCKKKYTTWYGSFGAGGAAGNGAGGSNETGGSAGDSQHESASVNVYAFRE